MATRLSRYRAACITSVVVALVVLRYYGWEAAADADRALVSKSLGGVEALGLTWLVFALARHPLVFGGALYASFEHLQVIICPVWFIYAPWPIAQNQAMCSAKAGFDIGALTIIIAALICARVYPVIFDRRHRLKRARK